MTAADYIASPIGKGYLEYQDLSGGRRIVLGQCYFTEDVYYPPEGRFQEGGGHLGQVGRPSVRYNIGMQSLILYHRYLPEPSSVSTCIGVRVPAFMACSANIGVASQISAAWMLTVLTGHCSRKGGCAC